jgi:hypothetical protein
MGQSIVCTDFVVNTDELAENVKKFSIVLRLYANDMLLLSHFTLADISLHQATIGCC